MPIDTIQLLQEIVKGNQTLTFEIGVVIGLTIVFLFVFEWGRNV